MRIIHLETGRYLQGGPRQVLYLHQGLTSRGHRSLLICPQESALGEQARQLGLPSCPVPFRGEWNIGLLWRLASIFRQEQPQVVHLHSRRGGESYGLLAARWARVPAVILSRRVAYPIRLGWWRRTKYLRLCDRMVAVSQAVARVLIEAGVPAGRVACVRDSLDPAPYRLPRDPQWLREGFGLPAQSPVVGMIARLIECKGHRFLLEAIPHVLRRFPQARFLLVGEGALRSRLERRAAKLGIADRVVFAGFREEIPRILAGLDLVVHPALLEGMGVALLEAMAAGLPVVASPVGGIPESVQDEVNGLLVPPATPPALAESICRLLGDPALRGRLGEAGRRIVETEFSVDRMVEQTLAVYQAVLQEKGVDGAARAEAIPH